jgi:hybrid cluster-associated redox disulfide protein
MQKNIPRNKITKEMLIGEIVQSYPETIDAFMSAGVFCFGCGAAKFETLEQGLRSHSFSDEDIDKFIKLLNESIKVKK